MAGMIEGLYEGEMKAGVREGQGTLTWSNGDKYVGTFKNGLRHGHGTFMSSNEIPVCYTVTVISLFSAHINQLIALCRRCLLRHKRRHLHGKLVFKYEEW